MEQFICKRRWRTPARPIVGGAGVALLGPTLLVHGTEEQKKKYLAPTLAARCSGRRASRSRAPALTSPRCRRVPIRDGDEYVINGQKMLDVHGPQVELDLRHRPHRPGRRRSTAASRSCCAGHGHARHSACGRSSAWAGSTPPTRRSTRTSASPPRTGRRRREPRLVRRHDAARLRALRTSAAPSSCAAQIERTGRERHERWRSHRWSTATSTPYATRSPTATSSPR